MIVIFIHFSPDGLFNDLFVTNAVQFHSSERKLKIRHENHSGVHWVKTLDKMSPGYLKIYTKRDYISALKIQQVSSQTNFKDKKLNTSSETHFLFSL